MMAVFLLDDDVVNGVPRSAGELVIVPDDYDATNIRSIKQRNVEQANQQDDRARRANIDGKRASKVFQTALAQLDGILQANYLVFWKKLNQRQDIRDAIINEMRDDPSVLQHALADPQWFVDTVTRRFTNG